MQVVAEAERISPHFYTESVVLSCFLKHYSKVMKPILINILSLFCVVLFGVARPFSIGHAQDIKTKVQKPKANKPSGIYGTLVEVGLPHSHWSFGKALGLEGMEVAVLRANDRVEIKRVVVGWSGKFKITLPAGKYIVEPVIPDPDPNNFWAIQKNEAKVTVWQGFYSHAAPYFDAGF